jgi:hypothetical protein
MQRFLRIFRLLALLSIVIAALAVALVVRGAGEVHASLIIATALGVGMTVLLGTGLMALMFISSDSGHDDAAGRTHQKDDDE